MIQTSILYYCVVWFICVLAACYTPRDTFVFLVFASFESIPGRLLAILLLPILLPLALIITALFAPRSKK